MRNFFDLEMDRTLTVDEYIETLDNSEVKASIGKFLAFAAPILISLNARFGSTSQLPELRIANNKNPSAQGMEGMIEISSGLISHCLSIKAIAIEELLGIDSSHMKIEPTIVSSIMLSWVLCHEQIHVLRKHNEVIREAGSEPSVLRGLEYDADSCATAAIYRHVYQISRADITDLQVRQLVMFSLFFSLRDLPVVKMQETHSPIEERIFHIQSKLIQVRENRLDRPMSQPKEYTSADHELTDAMAQLIMKCEEHYHAMSFPSIPKDFIVDLLDMIRVGRQARAAYEWEELVETVTRLSNTRA